MDVSENSGTPKCYFLMDDLGGKPTIFGNMSLICFKDLSCLKKLPVRRKDLISRWRMKRKSRRSATTSYHPRELTWIPKNDGPWKRWTPDSKMAIFVGYLYICIYVRFLGGFLEFWGFGMWDKILLKLIKMIKAGVLVQFEIADLDRFGTTDFWSLYVKQQ